MLLLDTVTKSESETAAVAEQFAARLQAGDTVLFYGELGAGKTTFIRSLVRHFASDIAVSSPTFALINVYPTDPMIYHIDLYRLGSEADLFDLGMDEYLNAGGITLIEWAEKCGSLTPERAYAVRIAISDATERSIKIEENGYESPGD